MCPDVKTNTAGVRMTLTQDLILNLYQRRTSMFFRNRPARHISRPTQVHRAGRRKNAKVLEYVRSRHGLYLRQTLFDTGQMSNRFNQHSQTVSIPIGSDDGFLFSARMEGLHRLLHASNPLASTRGLLAACVKITCRTRLPTRNLFTGQCIKKCYRLDAQDVVRVADGRFIRTATAPSP